MMYPHLAPLYEAADCLQEFNIRGALDTLRKLGRELKKHFMKGYQRGKFRPWEGEPVDPKKDKKGKKKKYDPTKDPNARKPEPKKYDGKDKPEKKDSAAAKRKEKAALMKRLKATDFSPAPKATGKMRAKKPGGGHLYITKAEYDARFGRKKTTKAAPKAAKRKAKRKKKRVSQ